MALHGKRILIIIENLHAPTDRRVWQEACALKNAGCEVFIICIKGKNMDTESYECINGIHIYRHPLLKEAHGPFGYVLEYSSALFWEFVLAKKIYKKHGFDVIQACNPPDLIYLVAQYFKKKYNVKFVFDHHDINPELYLAKFGKKDLFYKLMLYFERKTYALADYAVSTNNSYREIAVTRGNMDPEKVQVVRSGPSLKNLHLVEPDSSLKDGKDFLISYLGTIGQQEGIPYLLKAARYIRDEKKRDDIRYIIMGGGPEQPRMKLMSERMGLGDVVEFTGRVPDETVRAVLSTSDMCVNPDEMNDMNDKSTMNKVMEYMAMRNALVQFDLKEGRYSAQDASLYAEPNNYEDLAEKIVWLLDHPKKREEMAEYGYMRIHNELEWKYEEPKYLSVYEKLLSHRGE